MSFKTADELGYQLVRLQLIEPHQLEECQAQAEHADSESLLRALEQKHYLTPYQFGKLRKGETDGLVLGGYKLMYRNASGSYARVYRACSVVDGRMIGLKILRQRWASDPQAVDEFRREAELGKTLKHKNITPIYDVGSESDYHYFTMEFVEGGNMHDFIRIRKKVSPVEATRYALDMSEGLNYALSKGVTHRDLKPTNVLMTMQGVAQLIDFGLAGLELTDGRFGDSGHRALEYATLEKGTRVPANDPRSDLYFLGTIYYELLAGQPAYPRTRNREERRKFSRYANVPPIRTVDPNLPRLVTDIVERLMNLNPVRRYQTPTDVIQALKGAMRALDAEASPADERGSPATEPNESSLPTVMCIESRVKQQNVLREYLSQQELRVLMLTDLQRGLSRLSDESIDCLVVMTESFETEFVTNVQNAVQQSEAASVGCLIVLSSSRAEWKEQLQQSSTARVLIQPITVQKLHREIDLIVRERRKNSGTS